MDGFRLLSVKLLQFDHRSSFWFWSELSIQNKLIIQSTSNQRDEFNFVGWLSIVFAGVVIGFFWDYYTFYLCYHHGALCLYEYFRGVTKRNWTGFLNCQLYC